MQQLRLDGGADQLTPDPNEVVRCNGVILHQPAHDAFRHEFSGNKTRHNRLQGRCRPCSSLYNKTTKERNQLKAELIQKQNNRCAICSLNFYSIETRKIVLDHDHNTAEPRSVLCCWCNTLIGQIERHQMLAPELINNILRYIT